MTIDVPEGQPADLDCEALLRAVQTDAQEVLIALAEGIAALLTIPVASFSTTFQLERFDQAAPFHVGETVVWWIGMRLREGAWDTAQLGAIAVLLNSTGAPFKQISDRVSPRRGAFAGSSPQQT